MLNYFSPHQHSKQQNGSLVGTSLGLTLLALVLLAGCEQGESKHVQEARARLKAHRDLLSDQERRINEVTESEEFVTGRATQMSQLQQWLSEESSQPNELFAKSFQYAGLQDFDLEQAIDQLLANDQLFGSSEFEVDPEARKLDPTQQRIWPQLSSRYDFESCQFGVTGAEKTGDSQYVLETLFEGRFHDQQGRAIGVKAVQELTWEKEGGWRIAKWEQKSFKLSAAVANLFEDVTESAISDPDTFAEVRNYSHWDMMMENAQRDANYFRDTRFPAFNDWESAYQFPCVSVLDWNNDGLDDLFLTDRWGPGKLIENRGDGTFRDVTEESGLKVDELTTCAIFADFDNDGDQDAFFGGSLGPSRFFRRTEEGFVEDVSMKYMLSDIKLVVSGSVADINGDGLLDLYLNTYGLGSGPVKDWIADIVRGEDQITLLQRLQQSHHFLFRVGPPNVVLLNKNGKLVRPRDAGLELKQWHFSYQSTWSDIDSDGDQDLYLCNDFAPDAILRNDTPPGSMLPIFVDVTKETIPGGELGFGMGASWGDYNNDGQLDLYVSNMYSKAGGRILKKFPDAHEQIKTASRGNFLFEKQGSTFKQVAGFGADDQHVSKVGWAFGGQFADFDNDSHLDIYVPSGFYSPPPVMKRPGDS